MNLEQLKTTFDLRRIIPHMPEGLITGINKWRFFVLLGIIVVAVMAFGKNEPDQRPNIIFILADDHSTNALSIYNNELKEYAATPNIDRIGLEGMVFNNMFCTNAICSPSRASILTGQYSHKNGVLSLNYPLKPETEHIGHWLQKAGYKTAMIGKWHLKTEPKGFDYYAVLPGQGLYQDPIFYVDKKGWGKEFKTRGYVTNIITNYAVRWMERSVKRKTPFCLFLHHKAPHGPWVPAPQYQGTFQNMDLPIPYSMQQEVLENSNVQRDNGVFLSQFTEDLKKSVFYADEKSTIPRAFKIDTTKENWLYQELNKAYLRTIMSIDESMGRILEFLSKNDLEENTLVIYTSDQGFFIGEHDLFGKRWMYEEALRVPFLARFPGTIKPGSVNDDICVNIDIVPTLLELAGAKIPKEVQGRSMVSLLKGKTPSNWRKSMYYRYWVNMSKQGVPAHIGIRNKRFKLIFYYGQSLKVKGAGEEAIDPYWEFFDLKKDPYELHNAYTDQEHQKLIEELKVELTYLKNLYDDNKDLRSPDMRAIYKKEIWKN